MVDNIIIQFTSTAVNKLPIKLKELALELLLKLMSVWCLSILTEFSNIAYALHLTFNNLLIKQFPILAEYFLQH